MDDTLDLLSDSSFETIDQASEFGDVEPEPKSIGQIIKDQNIGFPDQTVGFTDQTSTFNATTVFNDQTGAFEESTGGFEDQTGAFVDQTATFVDQTTTFVDQTGILEDPIVAIKDPMQQTASLANRTMSPNRSFDSSEGGFDLMAYARKFPHGGDSM